LILGIEIAVFGAIVMSSIAEYGISLEVFTTLEVQVKALAPYATEQEIKIIVRDWALMRSENDYDGIEQNLRQLGDKYNVKLPSSNLAPMALNRR
jgi:hypothetical protein